MHEYPLWQTFADWQAHYRWVDLTHPLSEDTPHWTGFPAMTSSKIYDYPDGFYADRFDIVSQYGTHVDAPNHFVQGKPGLDFFGADRLVMPLCVLNVTAQVADNPDYEVVPEDIHAWEADHGRIPEGAFVAARSDWHKRDDMNNFDAEGNKHYPGWSLAAVQFLVEARNIGAIGHETSDTDAGFVAMANGFAVETYILAQERFQIELMAHLDEVPEAGALIFCGFPKAVGYSGFTARCIALCPKTSV